MIIGRAEDGSEVPQRRHEVAPKHLSERPSWSDPVKSLAIFIPLEAQSDLPRATCPERRTEVARISHPSRSDLPKRHPEVARVSMARRHEAKPGVTSQSDPLRSLPEAGATCRSDMPRSLRVYCWVDFYLLKGLLVISLCTFLLLKTYVLSTFWQPQDGLSFVLRKTFGKFIS